MSSYKPQHVRTKLDWFINGALKQTFDSYTHAAEVLKIEYNDQTFNEAGIRNLIKNKGCNEKTNNKKQKGGSKKQFIDTKHTLKSKKFIDRLDLDYNGLLIIYLMNR